MRSMKSGVKWVLGFDGDCRRCGKLASQLVHLSEGKLAAVRLQSETVSRWREQTLGPTRLGCQLSSG